MEQRNNCDWQPAVKTLGTTTPLPDCAWQEEMQVSPDGETFAAVIALEDGSFTLRVNDGTWETSADKFCTCLFAPDNRLTAIAQVDGEWTLAVDDVLGEERADYVWGTRFSKEGSTIAAPFQTGMEYGMLVNGTPWEDLYTSATGFALSRDGKGSCAVVQTASLGQADLEGFRQGVYSVAVNGKVWDTSWLNAWSPCFDHEGHRVACTVRLTPYEYSIAINGQCWEETFSCAWEPCFEPKSGDVIAPVRKNGAWGMARNGSSFWKPIFTQCWAPQATAADGQHIWAIVAPRYGAFTVAHNAEPWRCTFPSVTDLVLSPDGMHAAALASNNNTAFRVVVDGQPWADAFDMAWPAVFSPVGHRVAAKVRKADKYAILVDGKAVADNLDFAWTPCFSPDASVVMFCAVQGDTISRHTIKL